MSSVEALIRKHENFEKSCISYLDKMNELELLMNDIRQYKDCQDIETWFTELCNRKERLLDSCRSRKRILNESKSLQEMLLHLYEVNYIFYVWGICDIISLRSTINIYGYILYKLSWKVVKLFFFNLLVKINLAIWLLYS